VLNLDYEMLRGLVRSGPAPLFATVSGAHLYGFPSPDSDVDLRGAFVLPLREILGLRQAVETLTISRDEGIQVDWVAHDVRKFVHLMTGRNGYVLEQVFSPLVVLGGPWLDELRELGRGCITRNLYHHYRGFARNQRQALAKEGATVKDLLYAYRVLFTGIHVLRSGQVEANLLALREVEPVPGIDELIARKREGAETAILGAEEADAHGRALDGLEGRMQEAFDGSQLPEKCTTFDGLHDFVVRARLESGRA